MGIRYLEEVTHLLQRVRAIKVAYRYGDPAARALYTGAGFSSIRHCMVVSGEEP